MRWQQIAVRFPVGDDEFFLCANNSCHGSTVNAARPSRTRFFKVRLAVLLILASKPMLHSPVKVRSPLAADWPPGTPVNWIVLFNKRTGPVGNPKGLWPAWG